ncbi:MAG: hypothetical protein IJ945_03030, partial [Oscillospiraceae bacterium]|nr:hypothetical protein [Oscillospiraceae bacterium]
MKQSKTHRLLSAVLAILMVVTMFPVTAFAAENETWTKVEFADITANDTVMIAMTDASGNTYALPNAQNTKGYVTAAVITTDGKTVEGVSSADYGWTITPEGDGYTITANGLYLYSIDSNNGIRVDSTKGIWTLDGNYLKTTDVAGNGRWLGIYLTNPDWRAYKNTTGNTANQVVSFYKLDSAESEEPIVPDEPVAESKNLHGYIQTAEGGKWVSIDPETLEYEVLGTGTATYTGGTAHNGKIYAADATNYYEIDPQNEYAATQGGELLYGFPMSDATSIPASTITIDGQEFEVGGYVPYIVGHSDLGISYLMRLYNYAEGTAEYSFISTYESIAKAVIYTGSELDEENKCYYEKFLVLTEGGIIYETKAKWTVENGALVYSDSSFFKADSFLYVSGGASMVLASEDLAYITTNSARGVKVYKYVISAGTVEQIGVIEGATSLAALSLLKDVVSAGS